MGLSQRAGRFKEIGQIKSIRPTSDAPFTDLEAYTITSSVQPPNVIHERDPIFKPGSETALSSSATFFETTETYGQDGVPQFTQYVVNEEIGSAQKKVSEYKEYFTVTTPGTMSTQGFYANESKSGAACRTPFALQQPSTFRKEGLVEVFLTQSNEADPEVAFSDENVNWCSISFATFVINDKNDTASVSASYRTFNKYLNSSGTTDVAFVNRPGVYSSVAESVGSGDRTYNTNGIFRSKVTPFLRKEDGTQMYLKTNVSFADASVNATTTLLGTISPLGFTEYPITDETADPPNAGNQSYTITPDSGSGIVSISVNGAASETIPDPEAEQTYTFNNLSGSNSIEAVFGNKLTVTSDDLTKITSPSDTTKLYVANGGNASFTFSETPTSITFDSVAQTFGESDTTFTTPEMVSPATINIVFAEDE